MKPFYQIRTLAALALILVASVLPVEARNVALIIGNSEYQSVPALPNPVKDAELAVSTFTALGFETSLVLNADAKQMRRALSDFQAESSDADVAAILFSGHGVQADNINYLVTKDTTADSLAAFQQSSVRLDEVLAAFSPTSAVRLLLVDACRDNPFSRTRPLNPFLDSTSRGLSRVNHQSANLLVVYSAQPN